MPAACCRKAHVYTSPEERAAMTAVALEFTIPVEHVMVFKPIFDVGASLDMCLC